MTANPPKKFGLKFHVDDTATQLKRLRQLFPKLRYAQVVSNSRGYNSADGHLVLFPYTFINGGYLQALEVLASMIREHRGVVVDMECDGKNNHDRFTRTKDIDQLFKKFNPAKPTLIEVPVQFINNHNTSDPHHSIHDLWDYEFALNTFSILLALLLSDALWEFSRNCAIVSGDREKVSYVQCVHGAATSSWNNVPDVFEVSPFHFSHTDVDSFIFPKGFLL